MKVINGGGQTTPKPALDLTVFINKYPLVLIIKRTGTK